MKKSILFIAGTLFLVGCAKLSDTQKVEPLVKLAGDTEMLTFNRIGECTSGEGSFEFTCNYDWKAISNAEWASLDVIEGTAGKSAKITVSVERNANDVRSCQINIFDKSMLTKSTIEIVQDGVKFFVDDTAIDMAFLDTQATIPIITDTKWTAAITGEGFTLDKTSGEGDWDLVIKTETNLAGLGAPKKKCKVVVSTEADIKTKEYSIDIEQGSGYYFHVDDLTNANVKGHSKSLPTAIIEYVGTQTATGEPIKKIDDFVIPNGTSANRRKNVLDWYEVGPNGPRLGMATGGSSSYYYEFKAAGLTFSQGSTSTSAKSSHLILPTFEGYRPYRVEIVVPTAGKTFCICANQPGYTEEVAPAQSKMIRIGEPQTNEDANGKLVWDVSEKSQVGVMYYMVHHTSSSNYKSLAVYYGE